MSAPTGSPGNAAWDRKAMLVLLLVFLALNNLPYAFAWFMTQEGYHFSGIISIPNDVFSYFAKMRLGYEGMWHYVNRYTTEPTQPSLLFMFYIFLGHVARWTGLGIVACYHVARILGSVGLMLAVRRLILHTGLTGRGAVAAFALCFSVSALSWLPQAAYFGAQPMDQYVGEAYCFVTMLYFTHLAVSSAMLVIVVTEFLRLRNGAGVQAILLAGTASFFMTWIHPRLLLTAGMAGMALAFEAAVRERKLPLKLLSGGLVSLVCGLIPALLILRSYRGDAILESWAAIQTWSPNPWVVFLGYGLLLPLGAAGAWLAFRSRLPGATALGAWMILGLAICNFPLFSFQRRMFQGMDIPLALLTGYFLDKGLASGLRERRGWSPGKSVFAMTMTIVVSTLGFWPLMYAHLTPGFRGTFPWYFSESRVAALEWLRQNTSPDDVVLGSFDSSQLIPAYSGNRVVLGQWAETFENERKKREVQSIFDAGADPAQRIEFFERYKVKYLFFSSFESRVAQSAGAQAYNPVYDAAMWRIAVAIPSPERPEVMILKRLGSE